MVVLTEPDHRRVDGQGCQYRQRHRNGSFVNVNKVHASDLNFLISVKVVNQTVMDDHPIKFDPIPNLKTDQFTDTYGDCFISGFQIGGEFNALISVKIQDQSQREEISTKAALSFTTPGFLDKSDLKPNDGSNGPTESDPKTDASSVASASKPKNPSGKSIEADATDKKKRNDVLAENEVTISVSWTGGGQGLKSETVDWKFETLREAAIKFPELVARTPVRTNAILTKHTALRSFRAAIASQPSFSPLSYENAGAYTTVLQDAYLDYKNIYKKLQLLGFDVDMGIKTIEKSVKALPPSSVANTVLSPEATDGNASPDARTKTDSEAAATEKISGDDSPSTASADSAVLVPSPGSIVKSAKTSSNQGVSAERPPYIVRTAYDADVWGIEKAKKDVRIMMGRIANEVDAVARDPRIVDMEDREQPFMSPLLFKQLLPIGKPVIPA